jgi:hypothetical protein
MWMDEIRHTEFKAIANVSCSSVNEISVDAFVTCEISSVASNGTCVSTTIMSSTREPTIVGHIVFLLRKLLIMRIPFEIV